MSAPSAMQISGELKRKLQKQWTLFAFSLGAMHFLLAVFFSYAIEDALLNRHLQHAASNYQQLDQRSRQTWQPANPAVKHYRQEQNLLLELWAARGLKQGRNMEIEDPSGACFHILRSGTTQPNFFALDVREQMVVNNALSTLSITFLLIIALVMAVAWIIASRFIQSALAPLEQLIAAVESKQLDAIYYYSTRRCPCYNGGRRTREGTGGSLASLAASSG